MTPMSEDTYIRKLLAKVFAAPEKPTVPKTPAEKIHDDLVEAFRSKDKYSDIRPDHSKN